MWARPPNSLTIVGSAVATIVESSAARSITSNRPPKTTSTLSCEIRGVMSAGAAACMAVGYVWGLRVVLHLVNSGLPCAISATIERSFGRHAGADDLATAVIASGRELVNRAFETVKGVTGPGGDDLKG